MEKVDLRLVPTECLIEEIMERSNTVVLAYMRSEDTGPDFIRINYKADRSWLEAIGLAESIKTEIFKQRENAQDG